uniref:sensor histidine kinase n=1 Tax=Streptomyces sp. PU-14G TaxID=2800808 RepID=UPI0034DFEF8F
SLSSDIETPALRVDLRTALPDAPRPPEAVETLAYFCAAELLANAARHADAGHVTVSARTEEDEAARVLVLVVVVEDDGRGGAAPRPAGPGTSSGLRGLAERVRTVDGTLSLDSPPGGPTTATVRLPLAPQGETT